MKKITLLTLLLFSTIAFSQKWDTKERQYSDGVAAVGLIDVSTYKVSSLNPAGKNVTLLYDPYFQKYTFDWINEKGETNRMSLVFKQNDQGRNIYIDQYSPNGEAYLITDEISSAKKVTVISATSSNVNGKQFKLVLIFDDLK